MIPTSDNRVAISPVLSDRNNAVLNPGMFRNAFNGSTDTALPPSAGK